MKKKKEEKEVKKQRKKKEELETEVEKIACYKCQSLNDIDANFCKKCGNPLKNSKEQLKVFFYISRLFKILSIALAIDTLWFSRAHIGTAQWDNIIIEYAFILVLTLICSTLFRIMGEGKSLIRIVLKKEPFWDSITQEEAKLIYLVLICGLALFCYSNTRVILLKPGNNYVDRRVGQHVKRWYKVNYARTGVKKCNEEIKIWKGFYLTNPFCYDYTYEIQFRDRDSCFIHYVSHFDFKRNQETFSYCSKK